MSLNCIEIENIIKYIKIPCIITNFSQIEENTLVIHTNFEESIQKIIISVKDNFNRICLLPQKESLENFYLRFSEFLNSNLKFYAIKNIYQINYSRIVVFELENNINKVKIVARLWGVAGNILVLDKDDIILECLKRYPKRNEWINNKFIFPERNGDSNYEIREFLKNSDKNIDNEKVYFYYKEKTIKEKFENLQKNIIQFLSKEILKIKTEIANIQKITEENEGEYLKIGELIKSYCYQIKKGDTKVKVFDYEKEKEIEIKLDKNLTPIENAEKYFNKYKKIKESKRLNRERLVLLNKRLKQLEEYYNEIKKCTVFDIEKLNKKMEILIKKDKKETKQNSIGREFVLSNGYYAIVSKNAKDAAMILSKIAKGNDYWFHIRDYSGSHVIVKYIKNQELPERVKLEAAHLAFYYSKANKGDEGDIYFTQVKYLHKPNSKTPGLVIPMREKNIKLKFDKKILEQIFLNNDKNIFLSL